MLARLSLRLRVFLFFAALALGTVGAEVAGLWMGYNRLGDPAALGAFVTAGAVAGFLTLGLVAGIWFLFDENVARAIERLAGGMRARAHADVGGQIDAAPARYLGDLAPAAAAVTLTLAETRNALAEAVARETTRLATEKARLETLLSDVSVGVLLCSADHQLAFYNSHAVELLGAGAAPGLDRRVFDFLREAPILHAYQRLCDTGDPDAASDLSCATVTDARVLAARMRLIGGGERPGYVLTLRDVTADMSVHAGREALLAEVFDRVRRPAANLLTVTGVMAEAGVGAEAKATPARWTARLLEEVGHLTHAITELGDRYDASRADWAQLALTRAGDLGDAIRARTGAAGIVLQVQTGALILRCDAFGLVALVSDLAGNWRVRALRATSRWRLPRTARARSSTCAGRAGR